MLLLLLLDDDDDGSPEKPVSRITSPQPCLLPMEIIRTLVPGPAQQTLTRKSERSLALSSRGSSGSECRAWPQHSKLVNTSASATQKGFRGDWKNCYVFSRDDGATFDDQPSTSGASLWTGLLLLRVPKAKMAAHITQNSTVRESFAFCFAVSFSFDDGSSFSSAWLRGSRSVKLSETFDVYEGCRSERSKGFYRFYHR